jgi:plastocyanin
MSVALAACSIGSDPVADPQQRDGTDGTVVHVSAKIFGFSLDKTSVNAGHVTFMVKNDDNMPHDFAIQGNGVDAKTARIGPGQTASLSVNLTPGTYTYICTVEGHGRLMHGTLTAK